MDFGITLQLILLGILLLLSGFFSSSETALTSINKIRLRHMVDEKVKNADRIQKLLEEPGKLLSTILIGNNIVNISASALATSLAIEFFGDTGVGIAMGVMTLLVLVFGEITPKALAIQYSEKISLLVIKPVSIIVWVLSPIVAIFNYGTNGLINLLGGKRDKNAPIITEEELKTLVNVSHEEGVLEVDEKSMIQNVFEFGDLHVKDVMIQRTDIVAININSTFDEVTEILKTEQYSRYPIYKQRMDNIVGILNVKDFFFSKESKETFDIKKYMRKPYYTFEFKKISEVFSDMKKFRVHMAVVLDEYGGTAGIVTIEDLIEEIVGEIQDEYDIQVNEIEEIKEGEYLVDGSTKIDTFNEILNVNIESEYYDSIGGYLIGEFGRLPQAGEKLEKENIVFTVEGVDKNRIKKVRIILGAGSEPVAAEAE
ncbi:hemolysin [Methanocella sp. CWC-04]|uniref:Hemolysin n=1 Tax=Methanooceanicella nereidis TaxID=2052831 RepID=A0AAP2RFJ0_9EURY|nr:hemolysin [Methanocella sp. CWC-04]